MDRGPTDSPSFGKKVMELKGPFAAAARRLNPQAEFDPADRRWRKQWVKDQKFSAKDMALERIDFERNPEYVKARFNIFRRIWQTPMNIVEDKLLSNFLSKEWANFTRFCISKSIKFYMFGVFATYIALYRTNDWQIQGGIKYHLSKPRLYPGDPEYPKGEKYSRHSPDQYYTLNFKDAPI